MTPEKIETIGQWLYGNQWRAELARHLGVNESTVRYWVTLNENKRRDLRQGHIDQIKLLVLEKSDRAPLILALFDKNP